MKSQAGVEIGPGLWGGYAWRCHACKAWQFEDPGGCSELRDEETGGVGGVLTIRPKGKLECSQERCDYEQPAAEATFTGAIRYDCEFCEESTVVVAKLVPFTEKEIAEERVAAAAAGQVSDLRPGETYEHFPDRVECSCGRGVEITP